MEIAMWGIAGNYIENVPWEKYTGMVYQGQFGISITRKSFKISQKPINQDG